MHNYGGEFKVLQMLMNEEKNKTKMREEMIEALNSEKLKLEQEVAHLKELQEQVKTGTKASEHHLHSVEKL